MFFDTFNFSIDTRRLLLFLIFIISVCHSSSVFCVCIVQQVGKKKYEICSEENYTLASIRHKRIIVQFIFSITEHLSFPEISHGSAKETLQMNNGER